MIRSPFNPARVLLRVFLRVLLRWLLPVALLLAQHAVWAHGFTHDLAKIGGLAQNDVRQDCCVAFEASADAACAALPVPQSASSPATPHAALSAGRAVLFVPPYASRAPPRSS